MQKKGDFYIGRARKQFLQAGIVIILVVVLVGMLLYVEPGQKAGKAARVVSSYTEVGYPLNSAGGCDDGVLVTTPNSASAILNNRCCDSDSRCAGTGGCVTLESITSAYPHYCAINFQEYVPSAAPGHGWVICDASMKDRTTEDDTFICDGTSWVQCNEDTDFTVAYDDNTIACNVDTGRWEESEGVSCGVGKEWVWSYLPNEDVTSPPDRIGCCAETQCSSLLSGCVNYDTISTDSPVSICSQENNWDKCGLDDGTGIYNKHPGDVSDGGDYECIQDSDILGGYRWRLVCNAENQFKVDGGKICYNSEWRDCNYIQRNGILDTSVEVSCNVGTGDFFVKENVCYDDLDNDWDGPVDCDDTADCASVRSATLHPDESFELQLRSDACAGQRYSLG